MTLSWTRSYGLRQFQRWTRVGCWALNVGHFELRGHRLQKVPTGTRWKGETDRRYVPESNKFDGDLL